MNCNPTLTAKEFEQIRNALWDLDEMLYRGPESLACKDSAYDKLSEVSKTIHAGLAGAFVQEEKATLVQAVLYDQVRSRNGFMSGWSADLVTDFHNVHDYLGADEVVYKNHWGKKSVSAKIEGDTWLDLWRAAEKCIQASGDQHHIFIERFTADEGNRVLILQTGS